MNRNFAISRKRGVGNQTPKTASSGPFFAIAALAWKLLFVFHAIAGDNNGRTQAPEPHPLL